MTTWQAFASYARRSIKGSAAVSELLYAILDGETELIRKIKKENYSSACYEQMTSLIREVEVAVTTIRGRVDVRHLAEMHTWISTLPDDDLSLRRAYNEWHSHVGQSAARVA